MRGRQHSGRDRLKESVRAFVGQLIANWSSLSEHDVKAALRDNDIIGQQAISKHSIRTARAISAD